MQLLPHGAVPHLIVILETQHEMRGRYRSQFFFQGRIPPPESQRRDDIVDRRGVRLEISFMISSGETADVMMEVIGPHRIHAISFLSRGANQLGGASVIFGDQIYSS